MNAPLEIPAVAIGMPLAGGFFAGKINVNGQHYCLIVAPKAEGEHDDIAWNKSTKSIAGALSYFDGLANTVAMAEGGSKLAKWALDLRISGHDDWYLPSQDELEILYRNLKPTDEANWCYARSGINLSAVAPTYPYTPDTPAQTLADAFRQGGNEAFDPTWYWSSTQHASDSDYAWNQNFSYGYQYNLHKHDELRARAVRRLAI
jgi:hypothetical protein